MSMSLFHYIAYAEIAEGHLSPVDRAILLVIAVKSSDDGRLCCAQREVARILHMDHSQFFRKVSQFEKLGILRRDNGALMFNPDVVKKSMPYRKDWSDTAVDGDSGSPGVVTDSHRGGDSGSPLGGDSQSPRGDYESPPSRKEEKNKKETMLNGVSDGQVAHLGYAVSAKPYRGGGRPADDTQMGQPSRVQVVKAQPQPTWWEQRANMKSFAERIEEQKQAYLSSKPKYTKEQEAFLDVYPKGTMDPAAFMAAWEMVIEQDVLPQELIDAARIAAASPAFKKEEGLYIPKPENWLMSKGWASYVEPRRSKRRQKRREESNREPTQDEIDAFIKQQLEEQERAMKEQNNGGNV